MILLLLLARIEGKDYTVQKLLLGTHTRYESIMRSVTQ